MPASLGRLNVTALLESLPAAPQSNHHLGKADLGRGHALIEAQPPDNPNPCTLFRSQG
jgi:hypothetical protein